MMRLSRMLATLLSVAAIALPQWETAEAAQNEKQAPPQSRDPYFQPTRSSEVQPLVPRPATTAPSNIPPERQVAPPTVPAHQPGGAIAASGGGPNAGAAISFESLEPILPGRIDSGQSFEPGRVLAIVGGHPIFVSDVTIEANQLIEKFLADAPESVKEREREKLIRQLLPKYIESKMLYIDVVRGLPEGTSIKSVMTSAEEQFDQLALPKMMEAVGAKSPAELDAVMRAQGASLRQLRRSWAESELIKYVIRSKLNINPEVSHQEMLDYYYRHRQEFEVKAKARWEQLMVRFDKYSDREVARQALAKMGNEVVYGASLQAVARRSSDGFRASDGGQHDWTTRGSLRAAPIDQALFTLPLNTLSDIIESEEGFHIIRVLERSDAGVIPFLEAQVEIRERLMDEKREAEIAKHLDKLRQSIPVEIMDSTSGSEHPLTLPDSPSPSGVPRG